MPVTCGGAAPRPRRPGRRPHYHLLTLKPYQPTLNLSSLDTGAARRYVAVMKLSILAGLIGSAWALCPAHRAFSPPTRRSAWALCAGGGEEERWLGQPSKPVRPKANPYGLGYAPTTTLRSDAERSFQAIADNIHDIWWEQRRARQRVRAGTAPGAAAAEAEPPPLPLDQAGVEQVLTEFVQSMYARTIFKMARCEPTDYGQIAGMFEFVQLERGGVVLKFKRVFETDRNLLDRMSVYLRGRIPQMQQIRVIHRDGQDIY